jgi:acyl dehydratase
MKSLNCYFLDPFKITESKDFAMLSYDFNPIHIDVDYSRNTRYGRPIVHGINVVMRVLEILAMEDIYIKNLNIIFKKPVFYDEILCVWTTQKT